MFSPGLNRLPSRPGPARLAGLPRWLPVLAPAVVLASMVTGRADAQALAPGANAGTDGGAPDAGAPPAAAGPDAAAPTLDAAPPRGGAPAAVQRGGTDGAAAGPRLTRPPPPPRAPDPRYPPEALGAGLSAAGALQLDLDAAGAR